MYSRICLFLCLFLFGMTENNLKADVKIIHTQGQVMVRFGLDEVWHKAKIGSILKNIDSILSGENGKVILELENGMRFELGSNAIIDIADIRKIKERELFMYLMTQKIDQLEIKENDSTLKVANVSIVHGESRMGQDSVVVDTPKRNWYLYEINGALALYDQHYFPNTIIKCIKIQNKYGHSRDKGKIDFYIAKSFEALNNTGQARDVYQEALDEFNRASKDSRVDETWVNDARKALHRLDQE